MNLMTRFGITLAVVGLLIAAASAHDLPISNMSIIADEDSMHVELVLNADELSFFSEIDTNNDGLADPNEIEVKSDQISKAIVDCFTFLVDNKPTTAAVHGIVPDLGTHHLTIRAHYPSDARESAVHVKSNLASITQRSHVVQLTFQRPGSRQLARLDAHNRDVLFDYEKQQALVTESPKHRNPVDSSGGDYTIMVYLLALLGSLFLIRGTKTRK